MKLSLSVPDDVVTNFCLQDNYQETVRGEGDSENVPNPETKEDYVQRRVCEYVEGTAHAGAAKVRLAKEQAAVEQDKAALKVSVEE